MKASIRRSLGTSLLALSAMGGVMASATTAEAATPPTGVTWYQANAAVSFKSSIATCYNITVDPETSVRTAYNTSTSYYSRWFTCSLNGKTIKGQLYVNAGYDSNRWAHAQYQLKVSVVTANGTYSCGSLYANSQLNRYVTAPINKFYSQLAVQSSYSSVDPYYTLNCGAQGSVSVYYKLAEGISAI